MFCKLDGPILIRGVQASQGDSRGRVEMNFGLPSGYCPPRLARNSRELIF
jgi:hypothetical protein